MSLIKLFEFIKSLNWGDVPTWLGSIGTVGTLIFALHQLSIDRTESKLNELKFQVKDVSAWIINENEKWVTFALINLSHAPVYTIVISLVGVQGAGLPKEGRDAPENYSYRRIFSILPPGKFHAKMPYPGKGMCIAFGTEIAFTDSNSNSWVRKSNGNLIKINQKPTEYYKLSEPFGYEQYENETE